MTSFLTRTNLRLFSALIFFLFIFFSYLVSEDTFTQFDFDNTVRFQDTLPETVNVPFSLLSLIGTAEITGLISFIILCYLIFKRLFKSAFAMFLLPLGLVIEVIGKTMVEHPGPPHLFYRGVFSFDLPSHYVPVEYAYPSGHVLRTTFLLIMLVALIYTRRSKKVKRFFIPLAILLIISMLVSRIYLGEHWTSDVFGGLLLGSSLGLLAATTLPFKSSINQKSVDSTPQD